MAGVGLNNLPCAKVSAESRKLKSSVTNGSGIGQMGRSANRPRKAANPTATTEAVFFCARRPKTRSMRLNPFAARRGKQNDSATMISVPQISIIIMDAYWEGWGAAKVMGPYAFRILSAASRPHLRKTRFAQTSNKCSSVIELSGGIGTFQQRLRKQRGVLLLNCSKTN